jgi:hypothetical protein
MDLVKPNSIIPPAPVIGRPIENLQDLSASISSSGITKEVVYVSFQA